MTDVAVAIGFVSDARSKTVSTVIGSLRRLQRPVAVRLAEDDLVAVDDEDDGPGAVAALMAAATAESMRLRRSRSISAAARTGKRSRAERLRMRTA